MLRSERSSLWDELTKAGGLAERSIRGAVASVSLSDLASGSSLGGRLHELRDRSVLLATKDQFATAIALIELDGIARRVVLYPGDLPREHIATVAANADIDAILTDFDSPEDDTANIDIVVKSTVKLAALDRERGSRRKTEWVLLTSGTTGLPKLTVHTLASLTGAITAGAKPQSSVIWSTFYDIRRYGGLQIFLRALLDGGSLVLSSSQESTGDFLSRASAEGVTHISGTPSHWRRALMSPLADKLAPQYVRLSGEIVDQGILDSLKAFYKYATIVHAFASTEAGVGFDVRDGLAGFPADVASQPINGVEIKIEDGSLRIRSSRIAARYLGNDALAIKDGFVDTGDLVELRGGRYYFVGRRDGVINVGGAKVHPEEIEVVLNRHPRVQMSLVKARKNPITGAIVAAEVVIKAGGEPAIENAVLRSELIEACNRALPAYKVPASIRFVDSLEVTASGKLARSV
jgi:acyl-coenzyme A synthetase/AMP-(fatty) acid ligase